MQRDTEGSSIASGNFLPKLEKGPDVFCDIVEMYNKTHSKDIHVVLAGWRRQYVIDRLKKSRHLIHIHGIMFTNNDQ